MMVYERLSFYPNIGIPSHGAEIDPAFPSIEQLRDYFLDVFWSRNTLNCPHFLMLIEGAQTGLGGLV